MNFEFIDLSLDDRQFKGETHNKNLEDTMKQAIVNFCKSMDTGLFLLDMPTGFGKTYSVLDFMVDNYDAPEFKDKKIFFVTTLKKNLPDKELREHFAKRGKADDYDKYCLRIEANADMVVEKLDELYRARKIPVAITMKQEFKDLHGSVKLLNEYRDKKRELKGTSKDIINVLCKNAEDAIRKQQEGAFRKVIESELKQFRTPKEKLKNIANNPEYHWIGELYPAVYTRAKRIFFMSMDKFFLGNTTIIESTYSFYNNDITKNAIIFIDEFDATRDRLLNQIITRGLENHIDYLGLFHRVYASLKTRDFPAELTTASKLQQTYLDEHKNAKNPMEIIEGFGGVFDETYNRFAMQYSFKTEEDGKGDRSRNFIFNDLQFHSVFEGENAFIDIDTDMKAKQNWLRFTKRRPTEKDGGVLSLLASVKGCLTYFQNGARNLSFNYKHHKDEDKRPGDDDYTFENAIESVLTEFHLSREQIDYWKALRELCLMRPTLSRKNVEQNSQYQLVYMCVPGEITAYSYEQEGDYNKNINIKFDGSLPQKMSEDEVHLKEIMQIPGVKALFEKHGYATSFVPNEFILTPPMFNNIYKGALGEVVGKYILEQHAGVTLQEMPPEFFELFDYTLGNGVYVDFKLWKETMLISAEEEKKNVLEKLDKCGGKRAVIINIMLDHNMQITSSDNGRIIEIPYLYRLDRKEIGTEIIAKINWEGYLQ